MKPVVLVTHRLPASVLAQLESACDIDLADVGLSADELPTRVRGKTGMVSMVTDRIDQAVLDAGSDLRVVANVAVGYDNIDVGYARSRGVIVTNTPDVLTEAVAEFTWGLVLAITRRIVEGDRIVRAGRWTGWTLDYMLGSELRGKQLGIVGPGRIGRAVAAKAPAFGMRVAMAGPPGRETRPSDPFAGLPSNTAFMTLDELLVTSDVVALHVPFTSGTHHLIDRRALTRMKRSAYLINASRGPVVDETALVWALQEHLIAGAALDVYEHEPAVHPELSAFDTVVLAPHLGSATRETRTAMAELAVANVVAVLRGAAPLTPVAG